MVPPSRGSRKRGMPADPTPVRIGRSTRRCTVATLHSRRQFLGSALAAGLTTALPDPPRRLRVAAIYTVFRRRSHAFNILENFLQPYLFNGRRIDPGMDVVSFYADQIAAEGDLTQIVAQRHRIPVYPTIAAALCRG